MFQEFTNSFENKDAVYKGYRLIACDGSDLCIAHNPEDKTTYFQSTPNSKGFNQLHLNAFYDLCNRTYVDAIIQPARLENENRAMCDLIDRYKGKSVIFIADRGYENYNIFAHAEEKGMYYLIRMKDIGSTGILRSLPLPEVSKFDVWKSITLIKKQTNEVKANGGRYRLVPTTSTFDYLDLHTNKFYDIKMRIVRFPITEDAYECIITNLPQEQFNAEDIKQLCAKRWGIEASFRELKYAIGLTRLHSKKTEYIIQEIWSRMTLYNF
nr:IS4 family transposase [uncultured Lachnoclostridium sp.]